MSHLCSLLLWAWLMASSFVVSGNMSAYASPLATSGLRFLLALVVMTLLLLVSWQRAQLKPREQWRKLFHSWQRVRQYLLISGALVGFFVGLFAALPLTTPLHTSVLYTLVPLLGVLIAKIWLKEHTSQLRVLGFVLGTIGAVSVLLATQRGASLQWYSGDAIFLGACVLLALHVVAVQNWGRALGALPGAFMIMLFGSIWLLPVTLLWGELSHVMWSSSGFWVNILYLTVFTTLLTFVLQQRLVTRVGASRLLAMSYTIPVWVAGYTAFSESHFSVLLNGDFLLAVLLLLFALALIDERIKQRSRLDGTSTASK
ncbi:DMT family transporter [Marinomonas pollencensis]|uniref:EamA-like transporter family protein n=1 Tax=Marinomonas pollencensis TaxID=491954 RepID=A0A3E0DLY0_9GAMM|nr:DMT family transporter [Marinomonas pollencensis]REG83667.1 EamA-like transporter family protein [Marinomonas pollencensis]